MAQFQDQSLDAQDRQAKVQMGEELVSVRQVPVLVVGQLVEGLASDLPVEELVSDQQVVALGMDHLVLVLVKLVLCQVLMDLLVLLVLVQGPQ